MKVLPVLYFKRSSGFSYIDAIYGLTIILGIIGVLYGSINSVIKNFRKAQLVTHANRFAQNIIQEIKLRKFDENIDIFPETPLTNSVDFGSDAGELVDNISHFDDVDDFHTYEFQDDIIEGLNARITVNYALYNQDQGRIDLSAIVTTLKRVKVDIGHAEFDNLFSYSTVIGSDISPDDLVLPPYATQISVNRDPGFHVVTAPSSLEFEVTFNEEVYVINTDPDFSLYIDFDGYILRGAEGGYTVDAAEVGELRAYYSPGDIDPTVTPAEILNFSMVLPDNITSRNIDDYLTYRPRLVLENGRVENLQSKAAVTDLPLPESDNSFLSNTDILPILPAIQAEIFTQDEMDGYNMVISNVFEENLDEILAQWPRAFEKEYYPEDVPPGSKARQFALAPDGQTINSTINHHAGTISLISPEDMKLTEYSFESILRVSQLSNNFIDDDGIGFIIAFQPNKQLRCNIGGIVQSNADHDHTTCTTSSGGSGAENYYLVAWRTGDGTRVTQNGSKQFAVTYGEGRNVMNSSTPTELRSSNFSNKNFIHDRKQISGDSRTSWTTNIWTKIKVERNGALGENINVYATKFHTSRENARNGEYDMSNTINIDLTEDPRYHKFLGPSQYGYTVWSQQYANWYENKLITDVVVRRDVAILLEEEAEDNNVIEFKRSVSGVWENTPINNIRQYLGYTRKIENLETGKKFLFTQDRIIVYPWEEE